MTAVAAAVVAVLFLTTGGPPLLFMGYGEISWDQGPATPYQQRYNGLQSSLRQVQAKREKLELRLLLDHALRRTSADPVIFRRSGNTLVDDPVLTAQLQPLWSALPFRRPEIRTAVVIDAGQPAWRFGETGLDSDGLCVVRRMGADWAKDLPRAVRAMAAECFFAESFGPPGAGVTTWMGGVRRGLTWDHIGRDHDVPWGVAGDGRIAPAWFQAGGIDFGYGWRYRPIGRVEMACLVGRAEQCESATGVGASGWAGLGPRWGYINQSFPVAGLPYDLMRSLGTDRFGQIWTSDDPIGSSYRRVTGEPMDAWLRDWARLFVGTIERDNGLSLTGWIGALLWLSLFGLLTFERLRQRAVT